MSSEIFLNTPDIDYKLLIIIEMIKYLKNVINWLDLLVNDLN